MRILIVNSLYPTPLYPKVVGGAERSVQHLSEALVLAGHTVEVIRAAPPRGELTTETVNGVTIHSVPIRNVYWPFAGEEHNQVSKLVWHFLDDWAAMPGPIGQILDRFCPDVLHTNNLTALGTGVWRAARARGIRIVHTLRDYSLLCPRTKLFRNGRLCKSLCVDCSFLTARRRSQSELVDVVIGNSLATLDLHLQHGLFRTTQTRTSIGSLAELGAAPHPPRDRTVDPRLVFGYIGRVSEDKGVHLLAEAFGRFPPGSVRLKIAGESSPDVQASLKKLSGSNPIEFLGFVSPRSFYEEIDIVVAPSLWPEPLPRSVIDAISYGRPVIASDRGGNREAMGDPPFGWMFDPSSVDHLVAAMEVASPVLPAPAGQKSESPLDLYLRQYNGQA